MQDEIFETNKEEEEDTNLLSEKKFVKFSFLLFGIGGLLSWNAILADLSFFINFIPKLNPAISFPFLNFFLNIIFQFILLFKQKFISYKMQLLIVLSLSAISLIILPISVINLPKNSTSNIIVTSIMILFQGFLNAITQNSFFGLVSYFPIDIIVSMSSGQGIAGILMNCIQYLVLFFIGDFDVKNSEEKNDNIGKKGSLIFFSISVLIILICLGFFIKVYQNRYFKKQLQSSGEFSITNIESLITNADNEIESELDTLKDTNNLNGEISFLNLTKLLLDINILTSLLYIGTFSLFPGCCTKYTIYKLTLGYNINTIGFIFNIFDTIGRSISSYFNPTKKLIYFVVLSRFIFLFVIPLNYYFHIEKDNNISFTSSIFVLFLILLSITNGLGTSLVFSIAPTLVPEYVKGKAGSSVSFYLILGIFLGTICGFGMNLIMDFIDNKNKK